MGGRYQEGTYSGDMFGMPFEGRGMVAYDNATEEFVSTWIDNMGTGMMVTKGKYDEALIIMKKLGDDETAEKMITEFKESILLDSKPKEKSSIKNLFLPSMKLVLSIGIYG